jgi:ABC-type polysaccharide/polyol phosphate transport system ATPase subunit
MKQLQTIAIQLTGVSKKYEIHHERPTLVEKFVKGKNETFWALKGINLIIRKGERVGIIGPNGSGKTTLLKIIAGITTPTNGAVETDGKIVSLIDLEAGFHPDLTGVQNIFLNGMLLGMKKDEIEKKLHAIIGFADIRQFIDAPMFTYSSGMALRLGFAVAVHANPDILLLDEGIAVGDQSFREKSQHVLADFFHKNKTVIVSTHWLDFVKQNCNKVLVLRHGHITQEGNQTVVNQYLDSYTKNHDTLHG